MKVGPEGRALIQSFESCKLVAYPDPGTGGVPWTIGWGHTGPEVKPGLVWTQAQADAAFLSDLAVFERDVNSLVKVPLTQNQFDALVSFAYNVGSDIDADDIAEGLGDSTLLKKLNAGDYASAADEFLKWRKPLNLPGILRRRKAERALFLS
ncbi:lysozyme [Enterobacter roggenkampii]|uniref:lysozyme n=1 Tax=Enterobacter roggenkampii TaxID=1812935 RepID=UPI000DA180D9|nr:lysozyme [Enterobacter roggenkampii]